MSPVLALLVLATYSDAARILAFFPLPAKSHHHVFRPILQALGKRGHEVVYFTGYPYEGNIPPGVTQVDISLHTSIVQNNISFVDITELPIFTRWMTFYKFGLLMAPNFLGNIHVQKLVQSNTKFDAVLMTSYIVQEYLSALIHKFGAVGIEILPLGDSSWMNELAGFPSNPSYQLDLNSDMNQNMNFWQRLYNTYVITVATFAGYYHMPKMQQIMDQYFNYTGWETRPPINELLSNRSLILTNSHFAIGHPVPMASNRIEIGGVNVIETNKPLPKSIQTFMDESKSGVIYFSLGSNINVSHPANKKLCEVFMKLFEEIPQRVLMKWEIGYPGNVPKNVKLEKWFPQQDVLAHKSCVLFIMQGGYLSLTEAVHFGVPVIGIPFFGDQIKNLRFVEDAGIGKMLRLSNITYQSVSNTVKEVLSNNRYKNEIMKRSRILRDRQVSPADNAVYWIEHAIKYPNALTGKGAYLSFIQLHLIDVKLFIVILLFALVLALWKLLVTVAQLFRRNTVIGKVKRN